LYFRVLQVALNLKELVKRIDSVNEKLGVFASWLTTGLVLLMCYDVFMRYFFASSKAWILELEWHLFALIFLLGASYALKEDKHVRVDIFYSSFSKKKKALVNLVGSVLFLIPWCAVIIWKSSVYAMTSFHSSEGSPQPGGLPARYIIKGMVAFAFFMLLMQAISLLISSILTLKSKDV